MGCWGIATSWGNNFISLLIEGFINKLGEVRVLLESVLVFSFSRKSIRITTFESEKIVAMVFPADETTFAFLGADSPFKVHCFNCWSLECCHGSRFHQRSRFDQKTPANCDWRGLKAVTNNSDAFACCPPSTIRTPTFLYPALSCRIFMTRPHS